MAGPQVVVGRAATPEDDFWLAVAKKMTPEKSMERLDAHGKYLFSTVSIVGVLLTGFGVFSPSLEAKGLTPLLLIPVLLVCISLAVAMMGISPRTDRVNRSDINSVRSHYNEQIRRR